MKPEINMEYLKRINRVIDHLTDNLCDSYSISELAKIACLSEFHFHRIFKAVKGETLNHYSTRLRLEKAARLIRDTDQSITMIALDCGFSSSSVFSRSFKKNYGLTPKSYKRAGSFKNSKICKELFPERKYIIPMTLKEKKNIFPVEVKMLPDWDVTYIRVSNSYEGNSVQSAFSKIIEWAKNNHIYEEGLLFGMSINDPTITPKHLCSYDVGFVSEVGVKISSNFSVLKMPSRSYAVVRVRGGINLVATAWEYLFNDWLICSHYEPDHAPAFEVFLDKDKALDWSKFDLELCLPIKQIV